MKCSQSQLFPENKHANPNSKININDQLRVTLTGYNWNISLQYNPFPEM